MSSLHLSRASAVEKSQIAEASPDLAAVITGNPVGAFLTHLPDTSPPWCTRTRVARPTGCRRRRLRTTPATAPVTRQRGSPGCGCSRPQVLSPSWYVASAPDNSSVAALQGHWRHHHIGGDYVHP
jgi:hypothetical protein